MDTPYTAILLVMERDTPCRSRLLAAERDWIRIQSGQWIRIGIQEDKNDPTKVENF
jgi:hypothetical protein